MLFKNYDKKKLDEIDLSPLGDDEICRLFTKEKLNSRLRFHCYKEIDKRGIKNSLKQTLSFVGLNLEKNEIPICAARNGDPLAGNVCTISGYFICIFIIFLPIIFGDILQKNVFTLSLCLFLILSPLLYGFFIANQIVVTDKNIHFIRTFLGKIVLGIRSFSLYNLSVFSDTFILYPRPTPWHQYRVLSKTYFIFSRKAVACNISFSEKNTVFLFEVLRFFIELWHGFFYKAPIYEQTAYRLPGPYSTPTFYHNFASKLTDNQLPVFLKNDVILTTLPYLGKKIFGKTNLERLAEALKIQMI